MIKINKFNYMIGIIFFYSIFLYSQDKVIATKTYLINKKLPLYKFKLVVVDIDSINHLPDYEILISRGKRIFQTIYPYSMDEGTIVDLEDSLSDINFDGYNDLLISSYSGENGKNQFYDCWLFDSKTDKFIHNEDFSGFCNVYVNDSLKQFSDYIIMGCASECYIENTYKVVNNKPIIIEKEYQESDMNSGKLRRFIEKYKNGIMELRKELKPKIY